MLKEIRLWNKNNPTKQKTPSGIKRHISTWFADQQEKRQNQRAFSAAMGGKGGFMKDLKKEIDKKTEKQRVEALKEQVREMKGAQEKG